MSTYTNNEGDEVSFKSLEEELEDLYYKEICKNNNKTTDDSGWFDNDLYYNYSDWN